MRKIISGIASLLLTFNLLGQSGEVFVDANANGVRDKGEKGIAGVVVSDGFSLVKSDSKGQFTLELTGRSRFVTSYTPSGYRHTTPFYIDVRGGVGNSWSFGLVEADDYTGDPVLYGDNVIYGANDGYVYCSTIDKGAYVWRYEMGLPVLANPVVDGEYLYVVDMGGKLVELSLNDL